MSLTDVNGQPIGDQTKQMSAYEQQQMKKKLEDQYKRFRENRKKQTEEMKEELEYLTVVLELDAIRKEVDGEETHLKNHLRTHVAEMLTAVKLPAEYEKKVIDFFGWGETKEATEEVSNVELKVTE